MNKLILRFGTIMNFGHIMRFRADNSGGTSRGTRKGVTRGTA